MGDWMFKHVRLGDANKRLDKAVKFGREKSCVSVWVGGFICGVFAGWALDHWLHFNLPPWIMP